MKEMEQKEKALKDCRKRMKAILDQAKRLRSQNGKHIAVVFINANTTIHSAAQLRASRPSGQQQQQQ
jgi:hypothetical protein